MSEPKDYEPLFSTAWERDDYRREKAGLNPLGPRVVVEAGGSLAQPAMTNPNLPPVDGVSLTDDRIENAMQAMSETHSSWEARCHAIMAELGIDYGRKAEFVPDEDAPKTAAGGVSEARVEAACHAWCRAAGYNFDRTDDRWQQRSRQQIRAALAASQAEEGK